MAEDGKGHRKKKSGRKADKRKAAETKKKGDDGNNDAAKKQNPKAFIFKSRGKAKIQRSRTAEKDQRRMHGKKNNTYTVVAATLFYFVKLHNRRALLTIKKISKVKTLTILFFLHFNYSPCD
jgi:adenine-specific DNA methylase